MKLELEVYFTNHKEIANAMFDVKEMIKDGCCELHTDKIKFRVLLRNEPKCREEFINDKLCMVFESKMNEDG
jgi:hypothetical protein